MKTQLGELMKRLRAADEQNEGEAATLARSGVKSCAAAVAGALITNPLDVIRNEMFKTDLGLVDAFRKLERDAPNWRWMARGADKNLVGVAVSVACTIFFTDLFRRRWDV